jgi:hypothetical protein
MIRSPMREDDRSVRKLGGFGAPEPRRAADVPCLLREQDPRLGKIQQQGFVRLRLGLLGHAQTIRYVVSKIDGLIHVPPPICSIHPAVTLTANCGDSRSQERLTWCWLQFGKGAIFSHE